MGKNLPPPRIIQYMSLRNSFMRGSASFNKNDKFFIGFMTLLGGILWLSAIGIIGYVIYLVINAIINAVKGPSPQKTRERFAPYL